MAGNRFDFLQKGAESSTSQTLTISQQTKQTSTARNIQQATEAGCNSTLGAYSVF